ncbi:unnamed protein product, partial [Mesorhabditis spiculigera]
MEGELYGGQPEHPESSQEKCNPKYLETVCLDEDEWTGGLIEINNGTHRTLKTQCCKFSDLKMARQLKSVMLEYGDSYAGGIVKNDKEPPGYDLVKEIRKTVTSDNQVQYLISIFRMPCTIEEVEELDDETEEPVAAKGQAFPIKTRVRRRMTSTPSYEYEDEPRRYATNRRRYSARRGQPMRRRHRARRPVYRQLEYEDMYDYDYAPVRRRPMYRTSDRLWPVAYPPSHRRRAYGAEVYDTEEPLGYQENFMIFDQRDRQNNNGDYSRALAAKLAREAYDQTAPAPLAPATNTDYVPSATNLESQSVAPAQPTYDFGGQPPAAASQPVQVQPQEPGPVGPPVYNTIGGLQQAPIGGYAQAPASFSMNALFTRMQCFSRNMEVETPTGPKRMDELQVGDLVLSIDENMVQYSPVIMFLHKIDAEEAEFNRIMLESGEAVELTDEHLIYVNDCENTALDLVHAKDVKVGQCLHSVNADSLLDAQIIRNITKVPGTGIYSPLTSSGDIFVNGVLSSCHSNLALKALQQTFFILHRKAQSFFGFVEDHERQQSHAELPFGVAYLTTVIDLFLPKHFF